MEKFNLNTVFFHDSSESAMSAYEFMGAHRRGANVFFMTSHPTADAIYVIGSFNGWNENIPMVRVDGDLWWADIDASQIPEGSIYKYKVYENGRVSYVTDPFCVLMDGTKYSNCVFCGELSYEWGDDSYLSERRHTYEGKIGKLPIHIYRADPDRWSRNQNIKDISRTYKTIAGEMIQYVKQMSYTHIELTNIFERVYNEDTQKTEELVFAATSRMGYPQELMFLVDMAHAAGIGIILDWNISDNLAIKLSNETLISNLFFWIREYHIDGIRISRAEIAAFATEIIKRNFPDVIVILNGQAGNIVGTCADLRVDTGDTERILPYLRLDFSSRSACSDLMAGDADAGSANVIKSIFNDGNTRLLERMCGDEWRRFAGLRALMAYQIALPCKKITFMGNEIGCDADSDTDGLDNHSTRAIDWSVLDNDYNSRIQLYNADLNYFYLSNPMLWDDAGFDRVNIGDDSTGVLCFCRREEGRGGYVFAFNFSPDVYEEFMLPADDGDRFVEVFNSDKQCYGGSGVINEGVMYAQKIADSDRAHIKVRIPPLAAAVFEVLTTSKK